jgi:hypothetical protein
VLGQDLRYLAELGLAERTAAQAQLSGVCWFCRRRADFAYVPVAPGELPNWREQLTCGGCGLITRVRLGLLLACAALERTGPAAVPYLTEQVTPAYRRARGALSARDRQRICSRRGRRGASCASTWNSARRAPGARFGTRASPRSPCRTGAWMPS